MKSDTSVIASLQPLLRAANTYEGTATQIHDFASVTVLLSVGAIGAGATSTFKIEESINGTDWEPIPASRLNVEATAVASNALKAITVANTVLVVGLTDVGAITNKYLRVHLVTATEAANTAAYFIRQNPRHAPANATGTVKAGGILID